MLKCLVEMIDIATFFHRYGLGIFKRICWIAVAILLTINTANLLLPKLYEPTIVQITPQDPNIPIALADVWVDQVRVGSTFLTPEAHGIGPIRSLDLPEVNKSIKYGKNLVVKLYCSTGFLDIRVKTQTQDDTYTIDRCETITIEIPATSHNELIFISTNLLLFALFLIMVRKIEQKIAILAVHQNIQKPDDTPSWFYIGLMIIPIVFACLIFWPGHFSLDELDQLKQADTLSYTNFHPIIHTVILQFFHSLNFPMGYLIMQSLLLVGVGILALHVFDRDLSPLGKYVFILLVYWNPAVLVSLSMYWKDILFSILVVGSGVGLVWVAKHKHIPRNFTGLILAAIGLFLLGTVRHNGIVSFGVVAIILWSFGHKYLKYLVFLAVALLISWHIILRSLFFQSQPINFTLYTLLHYLNSYVVTHPGSRQFPSSVTDILTTEEQRYFIEPNGTNWAVGNPNINHQLLRSYRLQLFVQFITLVIKHPTSVWQTFLEHAHFALFWLQDNDRPVYWFQFENLSSRYATSLLPTEKLAHLIKIKILHFSALPISIFFWPISLLILIQLLTLIIAKQKKTLMLLLLPALVQYPIILPLLPGPDYRYFFFFLLNTPLVLALIISLFKYEDGEVKLRSTSVQEE